MLIRRIAYVASLVILSAALSTVSYAASTATGTIKGNYILPPDSVITCSNNPTCALSSTSTGTFIDDTLKSGQTMQIKVVPFPSTSKENFCVFDVTYTHKTALGKGGSLIAIIMRDQASGYTCTPTYDKANNNTLTTNIEVKGPLQQ